MGFFWNKKAGIDAVIIPDFGWPKETAGKSKIQWSNTEQAMSLSVNFIKMEPDIPTLKDIEQIRNLYRKMVHEANGGIIEVELVELKTILCVRLLIKIPQSPTGMTYIGSLTIPFKNCSYVLKVQAFEVGITGMRDAVILDKLLAKKVASLEKGVLKGWFFDPYESKPSGTTLLMNRSESLEYDADFPGHPLTRVREKLKIIESTIEFKKEIFDLKKFEK